MPTSGNKRVTQLVELTAGEIAFDDLFYIVDVSARESKRIKTSELSSWLNGSGSIYAFHAVTADTASWAINVVGNTVGSSSTSNFAIASLSASWASQSFRAISSSYALTASFAMNSNTTGSDSASFLVYSGFPNGTSSCALNALTADTSTATSFLLYFGGNNGTASHAIVADTAIFATNAATASYLNVSVGTVASASYAVNADTASSVFNNTVPTASFLEYSPTNGTASYAISAGSVANVMNNYGVFQPIFQSTSGSGFDTLTVNSSLGTVQNTMIQALGNARVTFTASAAFSPTDYFLYLYLIDRSTGASGSLDASRINVNVTPFVSVWGFPGSGSATIPFNLLGQVELFGDYYLSVSSSAPNLTIDSTRNVQYILSSYSDQLSVNAGLPLQFYLSPSSSVTLSFSSSAVPNGVHDYLPGFNLTSSQLITEVSVFSQSVDTILYTWALPNLRKFDCSENPALTNLSHNFARSLRELRCNDCSIVTPPSLANTTASYFDCNNNQILALRELSPSMSFLDASNNPISAIPDPLPVTLQYFFMHDTAISGTVPTLPDVLIQARLYNTNISALPNPLPLSMSYLDINSTLMATMSAAPISLSYVDVSSASFGDVSLQNLSSDLIDNAQISGTFILRGYGTPSLSLLTNLTILSGSYGWNVQHD